MKTGPPGYLYKHIHTRTQPRTHSRTQSITQTHTHVKFITVYIQYIHALTQTCTCARTHIQTYLTYKCLHSRAHILPAYMHIYTHADADYTIHSRRCASYARIHAHTHTNKQIRACMRTRRNTENYTYHIRRK